MRKNLFTFALLGSAAALPMQSIAKQKTEQNKKDKLWILTIFQKQAKTVTVS